MDTGLCLKIFLQTKLSHWTPLSRGLGPLTLFACPGPGHGSRRFYHLTMHRHECQCALASSLPHRSPLIVRHVTADTQVHSKQSHIWTSKEHLSLHIKR